MNKGVIVISAVNLLEGGGLQVLKECLTELSTSYYVRDYIIIALVNNKGLFHNINGVEFVEYPKAKKRYLYRFYYEYFKFYKLSLKWKPKLWFSLHDMSPKVKADVQAVYMHTPMPFYKPKLIDWKYVPINAVWAYLYKYIYRINIHSNDYLVVQQQWLRNEFSRMFNFDNEKIVVAKPTNSSSESKIFASNIIKSKKEIYRFVYPAYPRVFKNFEVICEAVNYLHNAGVNGFEVVLTIDGSENKYSKYIYKKYNNLPEIQFVGLQPRERVEELYKESSCLLFPSKLETWGLPISEFISYKKPMIISDLAYAHETAEGANMVCFVEPDSHIQFAAAMHNIINGVFKKFVEVPIRNINDPQTTSWRELFDFLLNK